MSVGSSVTWTHCSVRYEVTCSKMARVRADGPVHPHGHTHVGADIGSLAGPARTREKIKK
jgi:hypothetical protein